MDTGVAIIPAKGRKEKTRPVPTGKKARGMSSPVNKRMTAFLNTAMPQK
jgi:hypothetical protein